MARDHDDGEQWTVRESKISIGLKFSSLIEYIEIEFIQGWLGKSEGMEKSRWNFLATLTTVKKAFFLQFAECELGRGQRQFNGYNRSHLRQQRRRKLELQLHRQWEIRTDWTAGWVFNVHHEERLRERFEVLQAE